MFFVIMMVFLILVKFKMQVLKNNVSFIYKYFKQVYIHRQKYVLRSMLQCSLMKRYRFNMPARIASPFRLLVNLFCFASHQFRAIVKKGEVIKCHVANTWLGRRQGAKAVASLLLAVSINSSSICLADPIPTSVALISTCTGSSYLGCNNTHAELMIKPVQE